MLPLTLLEEGEALARREVVWFVDNTAALSGVVKGSSSHRVLERLIGAFWILAYRSQVTVWIEYGTSGDNWSDGISRELDKDVFSREHGFSIEELQWEPDTLMVSYPEFWEFQRSSMLRMSAANISGSVDNKLHVLNKVGLQWEFC